MLSYCFVFLVALSLVSIMLVLLKFLALKINFVSLKGSSCLGGLSMWIVFSLAGFLVSSICGRLDNTVRGVILGSALIMAAGIIDDYKRELSIPVKLLVQVAATTLLILFGVKTQIAYIGPYLNLLVTFLWVVGITNAFNHLDIMDGLAGGVAVICSATFFVIALLNFNPGVAIFFLALAATTLGFLKYNLSSAKIYMGNSGSHFLGFVLAAMAIAISYAPLERKLSLFSPIIILGLPIFDTLFLMFARAKKGRSVLRKSNDHFALRLLAGGYSKKRALSFMYLFNLLFCLSGLIISQVSGQIAVFVLVAVIAVCLVLGKRIIKYPVNE